MIGPMVQRLTSLWYRTDIPTRQSGAMWYVNARRTIRELQLRCKSGGRYHTSATVAGVVAALSPRLQWTTNVRAARAVLEGRVPTGVFTASLAKAQRIVAGEAPLSVLSGPKTRAFYRALQGDEGAAVVDVWVLRAVGWTRTVTERVYTAIARALQLAAARVGTTTARLQAAVWVAVRGRA